MIGQPQTSIFAAFGSFAMLVLVEFGGPWRARLLAYLGLACVGAAFITLGTLCSRNAWLGAGAMALVGFATLFAGVFSGYFAAGATGALLTFVLPVTVPAPNSAIPDRLEGWGLAAGVGICAVMLLWPPRRSADLQREAAGALRPVADFLDAEPGAVAERARLARGAVDALGRRLLGTQHRPTGPTGPTAALASLPDELDWLLSFLTPSAERPALELACAEDAEAMAAAAAVLRASAERLEGGDGRPDPHGWTLRETPSRTHSCSGCRSCRPTPPPVRSRRRSSRRSGSARRRTPPVRSRATRCARPGKEAPELDRATSRSRAGAALEATEKLAVEHASARSVWFQNSIRGAAGLAVAVFIAQRTGLQHGFWVVLGTFSVLRSNALGTGWSILSALAGTAVGIVVGALLVIGSARTKRCCGACCRSRCCSPPTRRGRSRSPPARRASPLSSSCSSTSSSPSAGAWGSFASRTSRSASRSASGSVSSSGRGARVRSFGKTLPPRTRRGADYVVATARQLIEGASAADAARAGRAADAALHRLDDAFRQYLAERSATPINVEDVGALVGGASRVRRAAQSLTSLGMMADGSHATRALRREPRPRAARAPVVVRRARLRAGEQRPVPPPHIRDAEGGSRLLACVRDAARGRDEATVKAALVLLWASQHLDNLWRLEAHLGERANAAQAPPVTTGPFQKLLS